MNRAMNTKTSTGSGQPIRLRADEQLKGDATKVERRKGRMVHRKSGRR